LRLRQEPLCYRDAEAADWAGRAAIRQHFCVA
jgi:hypothetical protein